MTVNGRGVSIFGAGNCDDLYLPIAADVGEGVERLAIGVGRRLRGRTIRISNRSSALFNIYPKTRLLWVLNFLSIVHR